MKKNGRKPEELPDEARGKIAIVVSGSAPSDTILAFGSVAVNWPVGE